MGSKKKHSTARKLKEDPRGCLQKRRGGAWQETKLESKVGAQQFRDVRPSAENAEEPSKCYKQMGGTISLAC